MKSSSCWMAMMFLWAATCGSIDSMAATFGNDVAFLRKYTEIIVLSDPSGTRKVAIAPAWQGRVMTSTADHDSGLSLGWINRDLIAGGKLMPHINAFGGEERFWLGPEGSQFSLYFPPGSKFEPSNWSVPEPLDTRPFPTLDRTQERARFEAQFSLTNYLGTRFQVRVNREVRMLKDSVAWHILGVRPTSTVALVAYESHNTLTNVGHEPWNRKSGLLSIWILGMFNSDPSVTVVLPIKSGPPSAWGDKITPYETYGSLTPDRLKVTENAVFFRGDSKVRGKIGISGSRSLGKLGSYNAIDQVLTLVVFNQPLASNDYVNSLWGPQVEPYRGDAINSYNDGPSAPGVAPLGPFYELETSSPAAALAPGSSVEHIRETFHLTGPEKDLDSIARGTLGIPLEEIKTALSNSRDQ